MLPVFSRVYWSNVLSNLPEGNQGPTLTPLNLKPLPLPVKVSTSRPLGLSNSQDFKVITILPLVSPALRAKPVTLAGSIVKVSPEAYPLPPSVTKILVLLYLGEEALSLYILYPVLTSAPVDIIFIFD